MIYSIARLQPSAVGVDGFLTGFTDFEPVNTDSYSWYDEFVIDTFPLESGVNSTGDMRPIHDSSGSQGQVKPAARWDCKRVETLSKATSKLKILLLALFTWKTLPQMKRTGVRTLSCTKFKLQIKNL
jgi:hypothetical protein